MFLERSDCRHEHCAGPNLLGCSVSRPSPARGNRGAPAMSHSLHSNQSSEERDQNFLLPPHPPQARRTAASRGQQLPCQMTQKESMPQLRSVHQRAFMDTGHRTPGLLQAEGASWPTCPQPRRFPGYGEKSRVWPAYRGHFPRSLQTSPSLFFCGHRPSFPAGHPTRSQCSPWY